VSRMVQMPTLATPRWSVRWHTRNPVTIHTVAISVASVIGVISVTICSSSKRAS